MYTKKNKIYKSSELLKFYSKNRIKWSQIYKSERKIIEKLKIRKTHKILDVGSGCGGLGKILNKKFAIKNYTGLEINKDASLFSKKIFSYGKYINLDLLKFEKRKKNKTLFDYVFSLGCVDWNVQLDKMLNKLWQHVNTNGYLVLTLRFTDKELKKQSYQYINFNSSTLGEKATYHVLTFKKLKLKIKNFKIKKILQYGYWGKPSITAVTPYNSIYFSAIAIQKSNSKKNNLIIKNFIK